MNTNEDFRLCRSEEHMYDHVAFRTCPRCEWNSRDLWRCSNHDKILRYQRKWRKRNPKKVKEYARRWRETWGPMVWLDDRPSQGGHQ